MTRINLIPPSELHPRHLVAEYRELPRVFALIRANDEKRARGERVEPIPPRYTMGRGHVRFFYDKAFWLWNRQAKLVQEMRIRGYKPQHEAGLSLLRGIDLTRQRTNWMPDLDEIRINRERIAQRLAEMGEAA